jgi:hypothetical protein
MVNNDDGKSKMGRVVVRPCPVSLKMQKTSPRACRGSYARLASRSPAGSSETENAGLGPAGQDQGRRLCATATREPR